MPEDQDNMHGLLSRFIEASETRMERFESAARERNASVATRLDKLEDSSAIIKEGIHQLQLQQAQAGWQRIEKQCEENDRSIADLKSWRDKADGALKIIYILWAIVAAVVIYKLTHVP